MFPYYTNRKMVPYDVRDKGPASTGWPGRSASSDADPDAVLAGRSGAMPMISIALIGILTAAGLAVWVSKQKA